jgi:two-component system OmpR family sensor kinase
VTARQDGTWRWGVLGRLPVRARLALWHVTAVAAVLLLFAVATSRHLARTHAERVDASLVETADLVSQVLRHEAVDEEASLSVAVEAGAREVRYRDRRVVILDASGRVLSQSDSTPLGSFTLGNATLGDPADIAQLLRAARDSGRAFASVGTAPAVTRLLAIHTAYLGAPITLLVAREQDGDDTENHEFLRWLFWMIPVALIVAGALGYVLVRQSLAPALAMARQAEQIGASGLDARLAISNAHDELGELGTVLNHLLGRLQAAFGQQRRFMADASHELRTPIAVVRSAADVTLHAIDPTPEAMREALETVRAEGRRMTRIVDDLFLLARTDSAQQPVHRERLYLEELVAEAAKAGRLLGRAKRITVAANTADEAPFDGDATLLMRLLMNLVDNAIKFSPADTTVRLHLSVEPSTAGDATARQVYRMVVADDGPGVELGLRATIFERFVRGDRSRGAGDATSSAGAGLGLAIARWIAEAHGGGLVLDTTAQHGAVFIVELPVPSRDAATAP